jgi:hypothetical protein
LEPPPLALPGLARAATKNPSLISLSTSWIKKGSKSLLDEVPGLVNMKSMSLSDLLTLILAEVLSHERSESP